MDLSDFLEDKFPTCVEAVGVDNPQTGLMNQFLVRNDEPASFSLSTIDLRFSGMLFAKGG